MEVIFKEDCNNAPRKLVLRDITIAWAQGDPGAAVERAADGIVWKRVGEGSVEGKAAFSAAWAEAAPVDPAELRIHHVITHGTTAAIHATLTTTSGRRLAFCDVYVFTGGSRTAKIKEITSYRIKM